MRRFFLSNVLLAALMLSQQVLASGEFCGLKPKISTGGRLAVICSDCWSNEQYALTGAAAARDAGLKNIFVENAGGNKQFHVTLSTAYKNLVQL